MIKLALFHTPFFYFKYNFWILFRIIRINLFEYLIFPKFADPYCYEYNFTILLSLEQIAGNKIEMKFILKNSK